jgi:hypothetical protein
VIDEVADGRWGSRLAGNTKRMIAVNALRPDSQYNVPAGSPGCLTPVDSTMRLFGSNNGSAAASVALNGRVCFRKRVRGGNLTCNDALRGAVQLEEPHVTHRGRNQDIGRVASAARSGDAVLNDGKRARQP